MEKHAAVDVGGHVTCVLPSVWVDWAYRILC